MHCLLIGVGTLITLLQLLAITHSQCPEYFRYFRNGTTGEIMGTVEIPSPPQGVTLHLKVILSLATVLPTKYVGRLELAKSKDESIRLVLQGMPLYYRIIFPVPNPIPQVMSIELNKIQFCTGPSAVGMIVTNIILEHTLYPPRVIFPLTEQLLNFISNQTNESLTLPTPTTSTQRETTGEWEERETPSTTTTTTTTTVTTTTTTAIPSYMEIYHPPKSKQQVDFSCGLTSGSNLSNVNGESNSLIISPILWPWLAAIFSMRDRLEFECNGNLISREHILTAAHCLQIRGENIPPEMLLVSLGRFNLRDWNDPNAVNVGVADYQFHPDFTNANSSNGDLAIIKLIKRIDYTPIIRPICLWMGKTNIESIIGEFGYVAGWSNEKRDKRYPLEPRMSVVSIVSQEECMQSNKIESDRAFCAKRRYAASHCDSSTESSGLVMFHQGYSRYHLRGIASLPLTNEETQYCDPKEYVVYVDVAKHLKWIRKEMISY